MEAGGGFELLLREALGGVLEEDVLRGVLLRVRGGAGAQKNREAHERQLLQGLHWLPIIAQVSRGATKIV